MKKLTKALYALAVLAAIILGISSCASGGKSALLKMDLKKGKTYDYDMNLNVSMRSAVQNMSVHMLMGYRMDVVETRNNDQVINCSYTRLRLDAPSMPGKSFDSNIPDSTSPMGRIFSAIVGSNFTVVMSPDGKVKELKGVREMLNNMVMNSEMAADDLSAINKSLEHFLSEEAIKENMEHTFSYLPNEEVEVGDSWKKEHTGFRQAGKPLVTTYTVKEIRSDRVLLDVKADNPAEADPAYTGTIVGTMEVERLTGFPLSSNLIIEMQSKEREQGVKMKATVKIVGRVN